MGQKVHPEAMRVGYIHDWKSNWFSEKNFSDFLIEDVRIRDHITNKLAHAGLSDITIRKDAAEVEVNIHTARPGIVMSDRPAWASLPVMWSRMRTSSIRKSEKFFSENQFDFQSWM